MSSRLKESTLNVGGFLDEFEKDQIKKDVNILSLFSSFGVKLEKKGNSYMGLCPFHDDKNPSLSVDKTKGLFHCFGCGASGDVFDLVMRMRSIPFREALEYLKKVEFTPFNDVVSPKGDASVQQPAEVLPEPEEPDPGASKDPLVGDHPDGFSLEKVKLNTISEYYHSQLLSYPEALDYLGSRKLLNWELLNRLSIGYAPGDLRKKIGDRQFQMLKESGVFTEKGREAFAGCITFPLFDESGEVVGLYGRKVSSKVKVKHLYLKGPHRGLFNGGAFKAYRERIIFTESIIDALSLMAMGVLNVVPIYGTNGVTSDHFQSLKDNRTKEVVLAFDNDKAGLEGSEKLAEKLLKTGYPVRQITPPGATEKAPLGCDWNEVLQTSPLNKEEIEALIDKAEVFYPQNKNSDFTVKKEKGKYLVTAGGISYRLLGVKELFVSNLKVNVRAEKGDMSFIDNCDLYSARSRSSFSLHLARLFDTEAKRVEKDLVRILEYLEEERDRSQSGNSSMEIELSEEEKKRGMELLASPDLFDRIVKDTELLGYVGEEVNKILVYLAASSRKLDDPISVIVMSESAAGKSYLIDTVKKLIPPEDVVSMTSLSDQALNYLPDEALKHKFLVMGEAVHSEVVEHQIREMLSAHELSRLVTSKDEKTGHMTSKLVRKEVIVSAVMSSTDYDLNGENTSRSFVVNTDESTDQTRRIHASQRKKYSTDRLQVKRDYIPRIIQTHHAAQRLLKKVFIVNPLAERVNFPDTLMRSRRDHDRFMDLIASVAFLRQYQKEEKEADGVKYIECDETDLNVAARIIREILPATLTNFPKAAQVLYGEIRRVIGEKAKRENLLSTEVSVTQRELREETGLNQMFVKRNVKILTDFEYLICSGSRTRGSRYAYRLVADEPIELLDLSKLLK
jgi:DNA primase